MRWRRSKVTHLFSHGNDPADTQLGNVDEVGETGTVSRRIPIHADVERGMVRPHQFLNITRLFRRQRDSLWRRVVYFHCHNGPLHFTQRPSHINTAAAFHLSPVSTSRVDGPSWRVNGFHYPSARPVNSGSRNRALVLYKWSYFLTYLLTYERLLY